MGSFETNNSVEKKLLTQTLKFEKMSNDFEYNCPHKIMQGHWERLIT